MKISITKLFILVFFLFSTSLFAQQDSLNLEYYFSSDQLSNLDPQIPTPQSVLGFNVGEWHISHDKLVRYMYALSNASRRISIENRGMTYENRELILLTISSEKNHSNIETIISNRKDIYSNSLDISESPVIIYQGFSIHGNEPSGTNSSLLLAYYLAASNDKFVLDLLDNSVILIDPCMNPDGLQRFASWVNSHKSKTSNGNNHDREFNETWPRGRTNHYWFDLNRDWLAAQHPESQARINTFNKWVPHILTDHHEMETNSTFFFQPGVQSRTHPLTPKANQDLTKKIAKYHAKNFDNNGVLYFSGERFDDFFYGKGSTFPDINGSIGILFEQASSRGHIQNSVNGLLPFSKTIKNQLIAGLSSLEALLDLKDELHKYQLDFFKNSKKESNKYRNEAIIFGDNTDSYRVDKMAEVLLRHEIDVYKLEEDVTHKKIIYNRDNSYLIPKNQKKFKLIEAIFDKRTNFNDSLFYDVSAWTFPYAFDLNFAMDVSNYKLGKKLQNIEYKKYKKVEDNAYAYLIDWSNYKSPAALNHLLNNKIITKVATKEFEINNKTFSYGTLLIPFEINRSKKIKSAFEYISNELNIEIHAVKSGDSYGPDLGSNSFKRVNKKEIALIVGNGVNAYDAGEVWHLLDYRSSIAVTKLEIDDLISINLDQFTTIIFPDYKADNESVYKKLRNWMERGGTLISYKANLKSLNKYEMLNTKSKSKDLVAEKVTFENKSNFYGSQVIGGAIFETFLDLSHPINYGKTRNKMPIFRNSTIFLNPDTQSYNNPIVYSQNPLLSGYISRENLDLIKGSSVVKIKENGKGKIIYLTDNTNFRAFWYGTNKILMNAIFFSDIMN
tara:strand:- start:1274 stop:3799 length:2526 start_codon:yes stop_codon:yes gene_type:complete